jgi:hypothetical protein
MALGERLLDEAETVEIRRCTVDSHDGRAMAGAARRQLGSVGGDDDRFPDCVPSIREHGVPSKQRWMQQCKHSNVQAFPRSNGSELPAS